MPENRFKICKVKDCNTACHGLGYCCKHYIQIYRYGHILERTRFDSNEIIIDKKNNCAYICLYNNKQQEIARAIIDLEDIDKVRKYKWCLCKGYAWNGNKFLHNLIMTAKNIDHIHHNILDNRKCNLRKCTHQQNIMNQKLSKANTSGYTGIRKINIKYLARIKINHKEIYLGLFEKLKDAIKARQKAEIKYFGEYAYGQ
jgi:hypothetical protein